VRETARGEDAKFQVPEALGDLQRAGPTRKRLIQLPELRVDVAHESADPAAPEIVVQPLGESLGLAQKFQHLPASAELAQHRTQLETELEALFQRRPALRECFEEMQGLLGGSAAMSVLLRTPDKTLATEDFVMQ